MKRILPVILILLGVAEIIIAVLDVKMMPVIAIVLGVIFIVLGIKTLLDVKKKK